MVLIPKQKKTEVVENPFRPKVGIPREHSVCRITWGDYFVEYDEVEQRLRVDADDIPEFVAELEANIPKDDRYRCHDHEIYLIDKRWKTLVTGLAKKYFDEVKVELRNW